MKSLKKELDAERDRADQIKKLIAEAETMLKSILGNPKGTDSIGELVNKVRSLIENERRAKMDAQKVFYFFFMFWTAKKIFFFDFSN